MSSHQSVDAKQFDVVSAVDGIVDQTVVAVVEFVVDSVLRSIGASRAELADVRRRPELGRRFVGLGEFAKFLERRIVPDVRRCGRIRKLTDQWTGLRPGFRHTRDPPSS